MLGKQIAHGQDISMEMHGAFGLTGGATGKGNQTDIVAAGVTCFKLFSMFGHTGFYTFFI